MQKLLSYSKKISRTGWYIAIFISINILGYSWFHGIGFDATENGRFTISNSTEKMVRNLENPVHIKLYASELIATDFPSLKNYHERVKDFLHEIENSSGGNITFEHIKVAAFSEEEDEVVATGLTAIPLKDGRSVFFGIIAENMLDGIGILPFMSPERETMLEFDIAHLIDGLSRYDKIKVALSSSLPMSVGPDGAFAVRSGRVRPMAIYKEISSRYDIITLSDDFNELLKDDPPAVALILHPRPLSQKAKKNLKDYLAQGGRVIASIDPFSEYPSAPAGAPAQPMPASDLSGLLKEYGIAFDKDKIILDRGLAKRGRDPQSGRPHDYLAWLVPTKDHIDQQDPMLSYVKSLSIGTSGAISPTPELSADLQFSPLIVTSDQADTLSAKKLKTITDLKDIEDNYIPRKMFVLAAKLTGQFPTQNKNIEKRPSVMVILADSDFIDDRFWITPTSKEQQMLSGGRPGAPYADNGNMLLNMIDHLSGHDALIAIRGRETQSRPLTYLEDIKKSAEEKFRSREKTLNIEIQSLRQKLQEARGESFAIGGKRADQLEHQVGDFAARLIATRQELRDVRRHMNDALRQTELRIKIINIIVTPLVIGLIPALLLFYRRRKHYKKNPATEKHNLGDDDA
ncbi:MAG: GldG family protein [Pseudomonadota bacterium]